MDNSCLIQKYAHLLSVVALIFSGLPQSRKFLFNVQVLDSKDPQTGCMFSAVHTGGNLGVVEANGNGVIDDEANKKNGFTIMNRKVKQFWDGVMLPFAC